MQRLEAAERLVAALQADFSWLASDVKRGGLVFVAGATTRYIEVACMVRQQLVDFHGDEGAFAENFWCGALYAGAKPSGDAGGSENLLTSGSLVDV